MSNDLYGVRVLDVAPEEPSVRFRVFVLHYETAYRTHARLPDDGSFFVRELWRAAKEAPLTGLHPLWRVTADEIADEEWLAVNTHRFVRRIERVAGGDRTLGESAWEKLRGFHREHDGRWQDEDLLVRADFEVEVTDPRFLEALRPGMGWGTTSYAVPSDIVADADEGVPHLAAPAVVLDPFPGGDDEGTPGDVAFSDDGRLLAVTSRACELVVYRTGDWSVRLRVPASPLWGRDLRWIPGTHRITARVRDGEPGTGSGRAFDVDTGTETDGAPQARETPPNRAGRELLERVAVDGEEHAFGPGLAYLAAAGGDELDIWRVDDGVLVARHHTGDDEYHRAFAWSPDGRTLVASVVTGEDGHGGEFRVYRTGRPAETEPTPDDLRAHADAADPRDRAFLLALLAEREPTPTRIPTRRRR